MSEVQFLRAAALAVAAGAGLFSEENLRAAAAERPHPPGFSLSELDPHTPGEGPATTISDDALHAEEGVAAPAPADTAADAPA